MHARRLHESETFASHSATDRDSSRWGMCGKHCGTEGLVVLCNKLADATTSSLNIFLTLEADAAGNTALIQHILCCTCWGQQAECATDLPFRKARDCAVGAP